MRGAFRKLAKSPGFTAVALLTLAFCIGANTAIFSMVYGLLLKPLPFPAPTRIVEIYNTFPKGGIDKAGSNIAQYTDYKANAVSYDAIGLWGTDTDTVGEVGSEVRMRVASCTAEMFDILGSTPVIGQLFTLRNSRPGEERVIVLMHSYWESQFSSDPGVVGKPLRVNGETCRIIGVAPPSLEAFDAEAKFIMPIAWKPGSVPPEWRFWTTTPLYARLRPNVSAGSALAEAVAVEKRYADSAPPFMKEFIERSGHRIAIGLLQAERAQPVKPSLYLLQGGVVFVLLIGCMNVANLLLVRANGRQGELAIRAALGASRAAIARELLAESLLITLAGALLGVGIAWGSLRTINHFIAKVLPNVAPVAIDRSVLGFAVALSVSIGVLLGLLPLAHVLRADLAGTIHRNSRSSTGGRGVGTLSGILVTVQVAVALVLLSGAGLLIHSFANAVSVNPGFDPRNVFVADIALPGSYQARDRAVGLQQRLLLALKEVPGVDAAALATSTPFKGSMGPRAFVLKDTTLPRDAPQPGAYYIGVSLGYFQALHIPLLRGRLLNQADEAPGRDPYGVVVDERFEKLYFPGRSAVGGRFDYGEPPELEVVGVVRNVPHNGVEDRSNIPFYYYPLVTTTPGGLSLFARTARPAGDMASVLREKLRGMDPSIALIGTGRLQNVIDDSFENRRAVMLLLGGFAALALFLSAMGIYGVLAYDVSQRTREIGIRGAVGAQRSQIIGMVMRQGLLKAAVGLGAGLVGAVLLGSFMASMLFELKPTDPWAYASVCLLLAVVALLASFLPARRAAGIDPIQALRAE